MTKIIRTFAIAFLVSLSSHLAHVRSQQARPVVETPRTFQPAIEKPSQDNNENRAPKQESAEKKLVVGDGGGANQSVRSSADAPRLSTIGRRDPFRPLSVNIKANPRRRENLSPLERYELGQLKLVGIVWDQKDPRALVEDSTGLGYIVMVGTPIGINDGKIKTIKSNELVVEETYSDFYGTRKRREINMKLSSE